MDTVKNRQVEFRDLGRMDFKEAWDLQTKIFQRKIDEKISRIDSKSPDQILFVEHPHVYTLGKSGTEENLLFPLDKLDSIQASYYRINRGGDITYHGPGQIVAYPILDLEEMKPDLSYYLRGLEESVIQFLHEFGIKSNRIDGLTGVWLDHDDDEKARKICAIGIKSSRWVTMHGLAFNINTDLSYYDHIVPCGIDDKGVTSLHKELGEEIDMGEAKKLLKVKMAEVFGMDIN